MIIVQVGEFAITRSNPFFLFRYPDQKFVNESNVLREMSQPLRDKIAQFTCSEIVEKNSFLSDLSIVAVAALLERTFPEVRDRLQSIAYFKTFFMKQCLIYM